MASCNVQDLIDNASCFDCVGSGTKATLELVLLSQIASVTDVDALIEEAKCFDCLNPELKSTVELQLLCEWLS